MATANSACSYTDAAASADAAAKLSAANDASGLANSAAGKAASSASESGSSQSASQAGDASFETAEQSRDSGDERAGMARECVHTAEQSRNNVDLFNSDIAAFIQIALANAQDAAKEQICPYCGKKLLAGNPVNVITGAKIEEFADLAIMAPGIAATINRGYNSQNERALALGLGNTFNYDTRIVFGVKPMAQEAYDLAVQSYNDAVQALEDANEAIAAAIGAYNSAISAYGSAASSYGEAKAALDRADRLLKEAIGLYNNAAATLVHAGGGGGGGGCPAVGEAVAAARTAMEEASRQLELARTAYGQASAEFAACHGTESGALAAQAALQAELNNFESIEAPAIRAAIQALIDYLAVVKVQMKNDLDIANAQRQRNKHVLDTYGNLSDQQLFGNGYVIWIDENGTERVFKSDVAPDPASRKKLPDGEMNVWPNGSSFTALYGRDCSMSIDAAGIVTVREDEAGVSYSFTSYGRLTRIGDRDGNYVSVQFSGRKIGRVTDRFGRWITFSTNADGRITGASDFSGKSISYVYDGRLLKSFTDAEGNTYAYGYDANNNLNAQINPDGTSRSYIYVLNDGKYKVAQESDELGNRQYFSYSPGLTIHTDRRGFMKEYHLDAASNVVTIVDRDGSVQADSYNAHADLVSHKDQAGYEYGYTVDSEGHVTRENLPTGATVERTYHAVFGEPLSETLTEGPSQSGTVITYWESGPGTGKARTVTYPNPETGAADGTVTAEYRWDALGRLARSKDRNGIETTYTYNDRYPLDGSTMEIERGSETTVITYDRLGRVTAVSKGKERTEWQLDSLGRVTLERQKGQDRDLLTRYEYGFRGARIVSGPYYSDEQPSLTTSYDYTVRGEIRSVTVREGGTTRITSYSYDAEGNPTSTVLPDGRELWMKYDEVGRLVAQGYKSGSGRNTEVELERYVYDRAGRITSVTSKGAVVSTTVYPDARRETERRLGDEVTIDRMRDTLGRLIEVRTQSADGLAVERYTYDLAGRIESRTLESGGRTGTETFVYDPEGRLISRQGMEPGRGETYVYDEYGRLWSDTVTEGTKTGYEYNAEGRLQKRALGGTETQEYRYDSFGRLSQTRWAGGGVESYEYDSQGRVIKVTDRRGGVSTIAYGELEKRLTVTDPVSSVWTTDFDSGSRPVLQTGPRGEKTTWTYNPDTGLLESVTGPTGEVSGYVYDPFGYLTRAMQKNGNEVRATDYSHDQFGRLTEVRGEEGVAWGYSYDWAGNLRRLDKIHADGTRTVQRLWDYDPLGLLASERYSSGGTDFRKTYAYDLDGALSSVTNYRGQTIQYGRYASGLPKEEILQDGLSYTFEWNAAGRLTKQISSDGQGHRYTYDSDGNLVLDTDVSTGEKIAYDYSAAGDLLKIDGPGKDFAYSYDRAGRMESVRAGMDNPYTFSWDESGNLTRVDYGRGEKLRSEYSYDPSGRMTGYRTVQGWGSKETIVDARLYAYDGWGDLQYEVDQDGRVRGYQYDAANRLRSVFYPVEGGEALSTLKEELRALGISCGDEKDMGWSRLEVDSATAASLQDSFDEWVGKWKPCPEVKTSAWAVREKYSYDEHGQRTSKQSPMGTIYYQYDELGRMLRAGNRLYSYDADGNRTAESLTHSPQPKEEGIQVGDYQKGYYLPAQEKKNALSPEFCWVEPGNEGEYTDCEDRDAALVAAYSYRADNRMAGYSDSSGEVWSYGFDALGRRTTKTRSESSACAPKDAVISETTSYLGLGFEILSQSTEVDSWKGKTEQSGLDYILGPGGVAYGAFESYSKDGLKYGNGWGWHWGWSRERFYHYEAGGNLSAVTLDKPGRSGERYEWSAFGQKMSGGWSGEFEWQGQMSRLYEAIGFAGQRMDLESGLYAYPYRSYDPLSAQWMEEDPIRAGEGWYGFCAQNPLSFVDPLGLQEGHGQGNCIPGNPNGGFFEKISMAINGLGFKTISDVRSIGEGWANWDNELSSNIEKKLLEINMDENDPNRAFIIDFVILYEASILKEKYRATYTASGDMPWTVPIRRTLEPLYNQFNAEEPGLLELFFEGVQAGLVGGAYTGAALQEYIKLPNSVQTQPNIRPVLNLRGPSARHNLSRISQGTVAKEMNTVIGPEVDVAEDVAAINKGMATKVNGNYSINGRLYGVHDGTLYPISGYGFYQLNRGAFQALGVLNKFGNTKDAVIILLKMKNVGPEEIAAALAVWGLNQ